GNAVPVGLAEAVAQHVSQRLQDDGANTPLNGVSLFSGAGGMDLGFQKFFNIVTATELVPVFCETLRQNFPETRIVEGDIAAISGDDLNPTGEDLQIIFGGPPCQPFSAAGKHGGVGDPRGEMVSEFLRVVGELRPKY